MADTYRGSRRETTLEEEMRSVRGTGVWTDSDGGVRGATVEISVGEGHACVSVEDIKGVQQNALPTCDRRIAYYLARVEHSIRAVQYANRTIEGDPKPKHRRRRRSASAM